MSKTLLFSLFLCKQRFCTKIVWLKQFKSQFILAGMPIKAHPIAKSKSVAISAIVTFLTILWNIVDAVSNLEFIAQKAGYQNDVVSLLASPATPKVAFFLAIGALVFSLLFTYEKSEKQFYETPENELVPLKTVQTQEAVKGETVSENINQSELQEKRAHDVEIFRQADALMTEESLQALLDTMYGSHSYKDSQINPIEEFSRFASKAKNRYLIPQINSAFIKFAENLDKLIEFSAYKFFPEEQSREDTRFYMQPDLNPDRGFLAFEPKYAGIYGKLTDELNTILRDVKESYLVYRQAVKENLFI